MRTTTRRPRTHTLIATMGAAFLLVLSFGLAGCQQAGGSDADRVAELERQVADLQSQIDEQNASSSSSAATASSAATDDAQAAANDAADAAANYPEVGEFQTRVVELEDACAAVTPSGDRSADYQTFLDMQSQLDQLEHEMDAYEDEREADARAGSLSREDYLAIDHAIDVLDDRLDRAEDGLERTLGIDD